MTPKPLMSVEEFTALPDDGMLHELNEGELITMPPPQRKHRVARPGWRPPSKYLSLKTGSAKPTSNLDSSLGRERCALPTCRSFVKRECRQLKGTLRVLLISP